MKPILVTGGAKGLGAYICRALASKGHEVALHYKSSEEEARTLAKAEKIHPIQGDFTTRESLNDFISRYLKSFNDTKGIVHNVGNYLIAASHKTTEEQWLELFQTNFFAPVFITQALLPQLRHQKGSIVNIGTTGLLANRGFQETMAYAATKSVLYFYTRSLARELANESVRVNMVSPGYMENSVDLKDPSLLPFKRPASLQEVADLVALFFEPSTAYITGQNIEIAGGIGL